MMKCLLSNGVCETHLGLLLRGVSETIQNEVKEQKGGYLSMLLGLLGARLLGNMLVGKGINRAGKRIH